MEHNQFYRQIGEHLPDKPWSLEQLKIWGVLTKHDQHVLLYSLTASQISFFPAGRTFPGIFYASGCAVLVIGIVRNLGTGWCILFRERTTARSPTLKTKVVLLKGHLCKAGHSLKLCKAVKALEV